MGPKKSARKAKVATSHPEPSAKTTKPRIATAKSDSKPIKKAVEKDEVPGADLFEHIKKRDLLSIAAPLASRKRAADFYDSDSADGNDDQQRIPASKPKKVKKSKDVIESKKEPSVTRPITTGNIKRPDDARPHGKPKKPSEKILAQVHAENDSPKKSITAEKKSSKPAQEKSIVKQSKQDSSSKKGNIQSPEVRTLARHKSDSSQTKVSATKGSVEAPKQQSSEENAARWKRSKRVREKGRNIPREADPVDHSIASDIQESSEDEEDQTAALLKGFESSESEDSSGDEGFEQGRPIPKIPSTQKTQSKLAQIKEDGNGETGVLYVGRIPHGFYEDEMRDYFSQFGDITRLRLSRNRLTGCSKHYAFIEFASSEVARIVADTMNNYLLFGHILKCRIIPTNQVHENLWKGANRKFRVIPRNKIHGTLLEAPKSKEKWAKRVEQETKRRRIKLQKLKSMGYEFELPVLKTVDEAKLLSDGEESEEAEEPKQLDVGQQAAIAEQIVEERESMAVSEAAKEKKGIRAQKS